MKWSFFILLFIHFSINAQEIPVTGEQQLEQLADNMESEIEDDSWQQELSHLRAHPLNLNTADREELLSLRLINSLQAHNLISYRNLLGMLVSIYELQAVPGWDVETIRRLLPYINTIIPVVAWKETGNRLRDGLHEFVWRAGRILEKAKGFSDPAAGSGYQGNPLRIFFRYRYQYKNLLQWGVTGEKDAGEPLFRGAQKTGFDFYSAHFFVTRLGNIRAIALGDFTVNFGQGLVHWQAMAFRKSAEIMHVKRESAVLRPYSSAEEFAFHRGAGITIGRKNMETTVFVSHRKLDANVSGGEEGSVVTSILNSGFHRSSNEISDRNRLRQITAGAGISYRGQRWKAGMHFASYTWSLPVEKRDEPYNLYTWSGNSWWNAGLDYSFTIKNVHVFGEFALDKKIHAACISGALISLSSLIDISVTHRFFPLYQAVYANAFSENTLPSNEKGLFAGVELRPFQKIRVNAYADIFQFPWLKYLVDAPSYGKEFMVQVIYQPSRQVEWYMRYRSESKERNTAGNTDHTNAVISIARQSWRMQYSIKLTASFSIRQRTELLWYDKKGAFPRQGYLLFTDIIYRPPLKPLSAVLRLAYFETGDYDSRVYAYENDVLYSFSIPALSGKGLRYYITLGYDIDRRWSAWIRLSGTRFGDIPSIGSGQDEISGNRKTEIKCQVRWKISPK